MLCNEIHNLVVSCCLPHLQLVQRLGSSAHNYVSAYVFRVEGPGILSELRSKCANTSRITSTGEVCLEKVHDKVEFSIFAREETVSLTVVGQIM